MGKRCQNATKHVGDILHFAIDLFLIRNLCVSHSTTKGADMQNAPWSDSRDGGTPALT